MRFSQYVKLLIAVMSSTGLLLGVILGCLFLSQGEISANIDLTLEFGALDGLWLPLLVPLLAVSVTLVLSPLSFPVYRLLSKARRPDNRLGQ